LTRRWYEVVQDTQDTDRWTVTVSIGRNAPKANGMGQTPMSAGSWADFGAETRLLLRDVGDVVFEAYGRGVYEGVSEDAYTLILADVAGRELPALRTALGDLARAYGQDSIALTHGQTTFCRGDWSG
jgi:hypothetical protein